MTIENKLKDNKTEFPKEWLDKNLEFKYSPSDSGRILVYGIDVYNPDEHNRFMLERQENGLYKCMNSYFMPSEEQRLAVLIESMRIRGVE